VCLCSWCAFPYLAQFFGGPGSAVFECSRLKLLLPLFFLCNLLLLLLFLPWILTPCHPSPYVPRVAPRSSVTDACSPLAPGVDLAQELANDDDFWILDLQSILLGKFDSVDKVLIPRPV
jgi:hypothetical protein